MRNLDKFTIKNKSKEILCVIAIILVAVIMGIELINSQYDNSQFTYVHLLKNVIQPFSMSILTIPIFLFVLFRYLNRNFSESLIVKYVNKRKIVKHNLIYIIKIAIVIALTEILTSVVMWIVYSKKISLEDIKITIVLFLSIICGIILFGIFVLVAKIYIRKNNYLFFSSLVFVLVEACLVKSRKNVILSKMTMYTAFEQGPYMMQMAVWDLISMVIMIVIGIIILNILVEKEEYLRVK